MKIGLFFGSFNPMHIGHKVIASYLAEFTDIEKVMLVVSPQNPFKAKKSLLNQHHRLMIIKSEIENRFNCKTDSKFTKVLAGGYMPTHIDPGRTAVVMFSLTDNPSPIVYFDGQKELFTHHYECATIINAKIHHGVADNASDRIAFQVNLYLTWDEVYKMKQEGTLYDSHI